MGGVAKPSYSKKDSTRIGIRIISDVDRPEGAKNKVNIIMLDKINKTSIRVC